jgi:L-2,4-diaminobutyric acid acetyltransferase
MNREVPETLTPPTESLELRSPAAGDAASVWRLVEKTPALDTNSPYAYLLLCSHFADTGVVGTVGSRLAGFVLGYIRPDTRPDEGASAFVWQVAVAENARGCGVGGRLFDAWFARCLQRSSPRFLEATVTPSNAASRALFASFAKRHGAPLHERIAFPRTSFPADVRHEDEIGIRIGPVPPARVAASHA